MSLKEKLGMVILEKSIDGVVNHLDKKARNRPIVKKESKPTTTNKKVMLLLPMIMRVHQIKIVLSWNLILLFFVN